MASAYNCRALPKGYTSGRIGINRVTTYKMNIQLKETAPILFRDESGAKTLFLFIFRNEIFFYKFIIHAVDDPLLKSIITKILFTNFLTLNYLPHTPAKFWAYLLMVESHLKNSP